MKNRPLSVKRLFLWICIGLLENGFPYLLLNYAKPLII